MITKAHPNYKQIFTFESIIQHRVDYLTAGRPADPLAVAVATDQVGEAMLWIIKRRGLLPELLVELGLCNLCQVRRGRGTHNG